MADNPYHVAMGGLPPQTALTTDRAAFTECYVLIPKNTMCDIVTSRLPFWENTRVWVLARPLSGFSETFSHYLMDILKGGGSDRPEPEAGAEGVLFVSAGKLRLTVSRQDYQLSPGTQAYIPPNARWSLRNEGEDPAQVHWVRKKYQPLEGVPAPDFFIKHDSEIEPDGMPGTQGKWSTTRFVDSADMRHDMHVNIVNFEPGAVIPFAETHVMEHGIFILEGKAVYLLNRDWVEVQAGDYMWLRAFCPQACYAGGPGKFRYLLYKDVNRHMPLGTTMG